jgi:hypothetical protein
MLSIADTAGLSLSLLRLKTKLIHKGQGRWSALGNSGSTSDSGDKLQKLLGAKHLSIGVGFCLIYISMPSLQ